MSLFRKARTVTSLEQLSAYVDKHNGAIQGTITVPNRDLAQDMEWEESVNGQFRKLPQDPETDGQTIEFRTPTESPEPYSVIVDEGFLAVDSIYIRSRHCIQ